LAATPFLAADLFYIRGGNDISHSDFYAVFAVYRGRAKAATLSGVVIETSHGRRPVGGTPVLYSTYGHDGADVYTRTDANGHYNFCRLPLGPGYVLAGCAGAVTPFPAFRGTNVPVEINGDTVLDVDITSMISSCP
jgi:hypothetical protein